MYTHMAGGACVHWAVRAHANMYICILYIWTLLTPSKRFTFLACPPPTPRGQTPPSVPSDVGKAC